MIVIYQNSPIKNVRWTVFCIPRGSFKWIVWNTSQILTSFLREPRHMKFFLTWLCFFFLIFALQNDRKPLENSLWDGLSLEIVHWIKKASQRLPMKDSAVNNTEHYNWSQNVASGGKNVEGKKLRLEALLALRSIVNGGKRERERKAVTSVF